MSCRLSEIEQLRVVRDDGKELGLLMDVRSRCKLGPVPRGDLLDSEALLMGAGGWLEQMGFRSGESPEIAAKSIVAIENERIVVRAPGARSGSAKRPARSRGKA